MADDPKLVVAISARLDQFEKQMREAGLIAEREMKNIEGKLSTTRLAGAGALGSLISTAAIAAVNELQKQIEGAVQKMLDLGSTAKQTGLDIETIQRIGGAAMTGGVDQQQALKDQVAMAAKMDEMNRHSTALSETLERNNLHFRDQNGLVVSIDKGLELAATLMARAGSESEKIELAKLFGLTKEWVSSLGQGVQHWRELKGSAPTEDLRLAVQHTEQLARLVNQIKSDMGSWGNNLIVQVLPALQAAAGWAHSIALALSRVTVGGPIEGFVTELENRLGKLHGQIQSFLQEANKTQITVGARQSGNVPKAETEEHNALMRAEEQLRRRTALLETEARTVRQTTAEQEKARAVTELMTAAQRAGIPVTDELRAKFDALGTAYGDAAQKAKVAEAQFQEAVSNSKEFGSALSDAFKSATLEGQKLDEVMKNLIKRLTSRAIDKIFDLAFAPTPGVGGSSAFMKLFEARAAGGPVNAGQPYLIGEKGPELFVPRSGGTVMPNSLVRAGGGGIEQNVVINDYSGHAKVSQSQSGSGGGVEVFIPAIEQMLASGVSRGRGALSKSVDARRRGTNLNG